MTDREQEIQARCEAATPGPWEAVPAEGNCGAYKCPLDKDREDDTCEECEDFCWTQGAIIDEVLTISCGEYDGMNDADACFIAAAREDIPYLLAETARLCAELEAMTAERDAWRRRAEAAKKALEELMESAYNGDRGMCYMCNKEAECDQAIKDREYAECVPEWRGPEEDKHE